MVKVKEQRGEGAPEYVHYELQDASPLLHRRLRTRVMGTHWEYMTQMLEILEWVCPTERQFEHARRKALDLINGEERALMAVIARTMHQPTEAGDAAAR